MRQQIHGLSWGILLSCCLVGSAGFADDPFKKDVGDPFAAQAETRPPAAGVGRIGVSAPTSRSRTLAKESYQHMEAELSSKTSIRINQMPLAEALRALSDAHQLAIVPNRRSVLSSKINLETPVTLDVHSVSLRMGLRMLLAKVDLDYITKDEVVQVTTKEDALRQPITLDYLLGPDAATNKSLVESIQTILDDEYKEPMPRPVVKMISDSDSENNRSVLAVTTNHAMHASVRNILRKLHEESQ